MHESHSVNPPSTAPGRLVAAQYPYAPGKSPETPQPQPRQLHVHPAEMGPHVFNLHLMSKDFVEHEPHPLGAYIPVKQPTCSPNPLFDELINEYSDDVLGSKKLHPLQAFQRAFGRQKHTFHWPTDAELAARRRSSDANVAAKNKLGALAAVDVIFGETKVEVNTEATSTVAQPNRTRHDWDNSPDTLAYVRDRLHNLTIAEVDARRAARRIQDAALRDTIAAGKPHPYFTDKSQQPGQQ